jgi:DNA polymerase-3 subunit delta
MQIKAEQLQAHLARGRLARLYVVSGDEALLSIEAQDALRAAARSLGYSERSVLHADARFDWSQLVQASQCPSLFSERRVVDIRLPTGRPGKEGAQALLEHASGAPDDILTLLSLPRLDKSARESAWARALEQAGVWVEVQPVERAALPDWIADRLGRQRQSAPKEALEFLAERVEGNLLAAHQEVSKLALQYPAGALGFEQVKDSVLDVARFDVFSLSASMLQGDGKRLVRTLAGLRAEGEALPLALWVVSDTLRSLVRLKHEISAGRPFAVAAREARIWGARLAATENRLSRTSTGTLERLLSRCAELDRVAKGLSCRSCDSDPWIELADIALSASTP